MNLYETTKISCIFLDNMYGSMGIIFAIDLFDVKITKRHYKRLNII